MEQACLIVNEVKKLSRRGKLIGENEGLDEKQIMVAALMVKCDKTEDEVLKAYDDFHLKHEEGVISKEDYTSSKTVSLDELRY